MTQSARQICCCSPLQGPSCRLGRPNLTPLVSCLRVPYTDSVLTFEEIAHEVELDLTLVEPMLMRAMSLGLVKGKIDEVEQNVQITFVKVRRQHLCSMGTYSRCPPPPLPSLAKSCRVYTSNYFFTGCFPFAHCSVAFP